MKNWNLSKTVRKGFFCSILSFCDWIRPKVKWIKMVLLQSNISLMYYLLWTFLASKRDSFDKQRRMRIRLNTGKRTIFLWELCIFLYTSVHRKQKLGMKMAWISKGKNSIQLWLKNTLRWFVISQHVTKMTAIYFAPKIKSNRLNRSGIHWIRNHYNEVAK